MDVTEQERGRHFSAEHELDLIHQLEDALRDRFTDLPADMVDAVVEAHYHELDACKIRDYVPVLVEHAAKAELMARSR
jgi:hypothetical protein